MGIHITRILNSDLSIVDGLLMLPLQWLRSTSVHFFVTQPMRIHSTRVLNSDLSMVEGLLMLPLQQLRSTSVHFVVTQPTGIHSSRILNSDWSIADGLLMLPSPWLKSTSALSNLANGNPHHKNPQFRFAFTMVEINLSSFLLSQSGST